MTTTDTQFKINKLQEKRNDAKNSAEKKMYNRMIQEERTGMCSGCHRSYEMVDWKKKMEEDKEGWIS
jgi:hypothetical protein